METAKLLLQLGNVQDQLDADYNNSEIQPVDAAPLEDFTRDLSKQEANKANEASDLNNTDNSKDQDTDGDKTVDYTTNDSAVEKIALPKGNLSYKQYGIVRQSPNSAPSRTFCCYYCEMICHSKRELNNHYKAEHMKVKCPAYVKVFPTPDALSIHRYMHMETHRFKCALCDKVCSFKSDLKLHMTKHTDEKVWFCD